MYSIRQKVKRGSAIFLKKIRLSAFTPYINPKSRVVKHKNAIMLFWIRNSHRFIKLQISIMTNNIEIVNAAVTLIIKAALLASRFSGRARKQVDHLL